MSTWMIISWVFVAILTGANIFIFIKLKGASEQMLKMAFPGAKNMNEALSKMQGMMAGGNRGGGRPVASPAGLNDARLKAAMDKLQQMQKKQR